MKKIIVLAVCLTLLCGCYTSNRKFSGSGIPEQVKTIEFYNGGTCIGKYENAKIELRSVFLFRINKLFVSWKLTVKRIKTDKSR